MTDRVDAGRRDALKRGGALGLAALGGCACPLPSWRMGEPPRLRPGALAPDPPKKGSLDLPIVIDAHCHIFNVEDVPASPMLKGPVAREWKDDKARHAIIVALADIISAIALFLAPSARAELRMLEDLAEEHAKSPELGRAELKARLKKQIADFSAAFSDLAQQPSFADPYKSLRRSYLMSINARAHPEAIAYELSARAISQLLTSGLPDEEVKSEQYNPRLLFFFAFSLTAPRFLNLTLLQGTYCGGKGAPAVDVFCPSHLDLNHWLDCEETATTQEDQMRLLEQIAIMSSGTILPFVAYNPLTDLLDNEASFHRVVEAVCKRGFVGVKLYPPMGFRPYGNTTAIAPETCPVRDDGKELDERLNRLYRWCVKNNVPVMAHTSHSFGKTDAHDKCAAPDGWQLALNEVRGLRVQAGHFGGDSEDALEKAKWAEAYVRMMGTPEAANLYVDVSNLAALTVPGSPVNKFIGPLVHAPIGNGNEIAANRILYGSDWYMTLLYDAPGAVLPAMNTYFAGVEEDAKIPGVRDQVLGLNAARLYGLDPRQKGQHETNWTRLGAYYLEKGIETPAWMSKLEKAIGLPDHRR